ncbi:MAG: N-6 DNA methylase, partial [Dehalococcoidales bacterium]|nr:N-6 DNA methylase [Dehalococcoidales bacterium]
DLALYGQDSNGTVWSICNMNMILHNISRFTIENGDTLEDAGFGELGHRSRFNSASGTVNSATYSGEQRRA